MGFRQSFFVVLSKGKYGEKKLIIQPQTGFFYNFFVHIFALLINSWNTLQPLFFGHNFLIK